MRTRELVMSIGRELDDTLNPIVAGWIAYLLLKGNNPREWLSETEASICTKIVSEFEALPDEFLKEIVKRGEIHEEY